MEIDISAGRKQSDKAGKVMPRPYENENKNMKSTKFQTGMEAMIRLEKVSKTEEKDKIIYIHTPQVFGQGIGKAFRSCNCSLQRFHSTADSFSCGK